MSVSLSMDSAKAPVPARTIDIQIASLHDAAVEASGLRLQVIETVSGRQLALSAARVEIPALGFVGKIEWQCGLTALASGSWSCDGPIRTGADTGSLFFRADVDRKKAQLEMRRDSTKVALTLPLSTDEVVGAIAEHVPVTWLKAPVTRIWSGGQLTAGTVDASVQFPDNAPIVAQFAFQELAVATNDGALAGNRLNGSGAAHIVASSDAPQISVDAQLTGGSLRESVIDMRLPETPVTFGIDAKGSPGRTWDVSRFEWHDHGVLELNATARVDTAATESFISLDLSAATITFPQLRSRLNADGLRALGIANLDINGTLSGVIALRDGELAQLAINTDRLDLRSKSLDFAVTGIAGGIDWAKADTRPVTALGWKSMKSNGLAIGPTSLHLAAKNGQIELAQTARLALFGGEIRLHKLMLDPRDPAQPHVAAVFDTEGIGYDSADGTVAAAGIRSSATLDLADPFGHPKIKLAGDFHGGEALFGPVYVKLPTAPVTFAIAADSTPENIWKIHNFSWTDPNVVDLSATATLAPGNPEWLPEFSVDIRHAQLTPAADRYAKSWLAALGYADLSLTGNLTGSIAFTGDGMQHFDFAADGVDAIDGGGRFAMRGFSGAADWQINVDRPATSLSWKSLDLFSIPLGAMQASLQSRAGREVLTDPVDIPVLGGHLIVQRLSLNPRSPRGQRYRAGLVLTDIAMPQLSKAVGWPEFSGTLAGAVPDISFD
ncbi:MAG: hypothetical protein ABI451_08025, partial [Dokdonella sp.]